MLRMTRTTNPKLNAKELRARRPTKSDLVKIKRRQIYIICDNILDAYNIGSIFRLADAVGVSKIYLCGETQTPPHHRIAKAAVGTEKWVPWQHVATVGEAVEELGKRHSGEERSDDSRIKKERFRTSPSVSLRTSRNDNKRIKVIAIEQSGKSIDYRKADLAEPVAFIVGHETSGVSKEALKLADQIVEIPMFGVNKSLNVMVSLAIILYRLV